MAFALFIIERDKEQSVRETLGGIGLNVGPGVIYGTDQAQLGCVITRLDQFEWVESCPGVIRLEKVV